MEEPKKKLEGIINGFSPVASTPVFWKSRRRSVNRKNIAIDDENGKPREEHQQEDAAMEENHRQVESNTFPPVLSQKRKSLFEPLDPISDINARRPSNESLLPPPDFDAATYPKGWLVGKKRKLVNVDVVESMRRIAVQEMNRKDREIDGLNEQLDEDAKVLEHLQIQLLEERSKRAEVERQNNMLQSQITMLMNMMDEENEPIDGDGTDEP
ncbi:hypothetical protein LIER_15733 [Lithospermum erythrorhizon]|uniref:Uncharacterized protein n=1 Tax=Lithospermum erythrorhizon TaxID=34254 RepID=A0AAV3Q3Y7_LITER